MNPNSAVIAVDNSKGGRPGDGAVYKGLAIGTDADGTFLYAANFRNGSVDMFNSKFQLVKSFTDPTVPNGYAPFNVQVLDGKLFVTFAKQDATRHDDVAGAGNGFVDEFNLDGSKIATDCVARAAQFALGSGDRAIELRRVLQRPARRQFRRRHH